MDSMDNPRKPQCLEAPVEHLTSILHRVQAAIENAHEGGHRRFSVQNDDHGIAADFYECLIGCSDESFNTIVFPLRGAHESLGSEEKTLESWAFKAKRLDHYRGFFPSIAKDRTLSRSSRLTTLKGLLFDDIGRVDSFYARTFEKYSAELGPIIVFLDDLQKRIREIFVELGITFVGEEDSSSETGSNASSSGAKSDASNGSEDTIRASQVYANYGSQDMSTETTESDEPDNSYNSYLTSGIDWRHPPLDDYDGLDGSANEFFEELNLAAAGRAPRSSPVQAPNSPAGSSSPLTSLGPATPRPTTPKASEGFAHALNTLDLAPKRTTMYPPKRHHHSALQVDPDASPVDRIYTVAMYLVTKSLKQAKMLRDRACSYGLFAKEMAEHWESWVKRVQYSQKKLEQKNREKFAASKIANNKEEFLVEDESQLFDAGRRVDPKVDSGKCGYL